jgi:hypothetical protein
VSCERCVLSGRGLCVGLITLPEDPTECGVSACDREASIMRKPWPTRGSCAIGKKKGGHVEMKRRAFLPLPRY